MTCKDCIHYEDMCKEHLIECAEHGEAERILNPCVKFKNKADFVEVKHGYWIKCQNLYGVGCEYVCSVCQKGIRQYEGQPRCSECGAKMVVAKNATTERKDT